MIRALPLILLAAAAGCDGEGAEARSSARSQTAAAAPSEANDHEAAEANYPLKNWMQANLARAIKVEDLHALEQGLTALAGFAPTEFPDWHAIAERGARAAAAQDIDAVRQACGDCHNEYRADYREQMRTRPLPTK